MACVQDPELQRRGIQVDRFQVARDAPAITAFFLTHAHTDHMRGLVGHFGRQRRHAQIWCTSVTMQLTRMMITGLEERDFHPLEYGQDDRPVPGLVVMAFPSYHADGSAMFWFRFEADGTEVLNGTEVLYTGDFRFRPEYRELSWCDRRRIDRLYVDDTFDLIDRPFPSWEETAQEMVDLVRRLDERGVRKLRIHCGILGIEPVLRRVAEVLDVRFGLLPELRDTWRARQLVYLLGERLDLTSSDLFLNLGNYKLRSDGLLLPTIVPSATYFLCQAKDKHETTKDVYHVFFSGHSNRLENEAMRLLVDAREVVSCGVALEPAGFACQQPP